jgi:predicted TIM-barrel fold metal-dependent hydrolase
MDKVIFVSSDSHAGMPKELWAEYLDPGFHDLLPSLRHDNTMYPIAVHFLGAQMGDTGGLDEVREAHASGYGGLHDAELRLESMDLDGVAAELIFHGDGRLGDLFHNGTNRTYPLDAWQAGAEAWNRWAADNFAIAPERFLVVAALGPCTDIDVAVADVHRNADRGFVGTYGPGYVRPEGLAPLWDAHWDPFWAACAERNLPVVIHAGYGWEQGVAFPHFERIYRDAVETFGTDDPEFLLTQRSGIKVESLEFFQEFATSVRPRQPLWQMLLGGVFDRHPNLKLVLTEIRGDWIPATLRYLDAIYDAHRDDLPAQRRPSEYWATNCLFGASFIHRAEIEMRHQIGVDTISFGRDYPHFEGTWPNTAEWLGDAFRGVPADEARAMLGENAIRFFGLDRIRLAGIAERIGPRIEDVIDSGGTARPEAVENFAARGGYLREAESDTRIDEIDSLVRRDLEALTSTTRP